MVAKPRAKIKHCLPVLGGVILVRGFAGREGCGEPRPQFGEMTMDLTNDVLAQILPVVQSTVRSFNMNEDDALDAIQDTLMRLCTKAYRLPADLRRLRGIAYGTTRNTVFNHFRACKRSNLYRDFTFVVDTSVDLLSPENGYQSHPVVASQARIESDSFLLEQLHQVINQLSEKQRQTLILYSEGFSYQEIAEAHGSCVGTVRSRLHGARRQARQLLAAFVQAA
jgi:RNA polymerase sigma factor (sigma-70 family)